MNFVRRNAAAWDTALALVFGGLGFMISARGFAVLGPLLLNAGSFDLWFQADIPRVISNLADAGSSQSRASVHPAASILLMPICLLLQRAGLAPTIAVELLVECAAGASGALAFLLMRRIGLPRLAACVFCALFLTSAAFTHQNAVPELSPFAAVTILAALLALPGTREPATWSLIAVGAATLAITVTNWSVGLIAAFVRARHRVLRIAVLSFAGVFLLSLLQYALLSDAALFFQVSSVSHEMRYTQFEQHDAGAPSWNPAQNLGSLLLTTVVAPRPWLDVENGRHVVTNQGAPPAASVPGLVALSAWVVLLGCGVWGAVRRMEARRVVYGLFAMLGFQAALHSVYGTPTFLYSLHFLPMLIAIAAFAWFTPARFPALALAATVAIAGGLNNAQQFDAAAALARDVMRNGGNQMEARFQPSATLPPPPPPSEGTE